MCTKPRLRKNYYILVERSDPPSNANSQRQWTPGSGTVLGKTVSFWHMGKGSDYSFVSPRQKCHDISVLQLVKHVSSHHLSFSRAGRGGKEGVGGSLRQARPFPLLQNVASLTDM